MCWIWYSFISFLSSTYLFLRNWFSSGQHSNILSGLDRKQHWMNLPVMSNEVIHGCRIILVYSTMQNILISFMCLVLCIWILPFRTYHRFSVLFNPVIVNFFEPFVLIWLYIWLIILLEVLSTVCPNQPCFTLKYPYKNAPNHKPQNGHKASPILINVLWWVSGNFPWYIL